MYYRVFVRHSIDTTLRICMCNVFNLPIQRSTVHQGAGYRETRSDDVVYRQKMTNKKMRLCMKGVGNRQLMKFTNCVVLAWKTSPANLDAYLRLAICFTRKGQYCYSIIKPAFNTILPVHEKPPRTKAPLFPFSTHSS
jgi:hypothetical protein